MQLSLLDKLSRMERLDPELFFDSDQSKEQRIAELSGYIENLTGVLALEQTLRSNFSGLAFTLDEISDFLLQLCSVLGGEYSFRFELDKELERALEYVSADGEYSIYEFIGLLTDAIIETTSGERIEQFSLDDALRIASRYYGKPQKQIVRVWADTSQELVTRYGPGNIPFPEKFENLVKQKILGRITKSGRIIYTDRLNTRFYIDPPWVVFDYPPSSIGWRMGGGEDYMDKWHCYFAKLNRKTKYRYLELCTIPAEWNEWVSDVFATNL